jgi:MscS family membrane protein
MNAVRSARACVVAVVVLVVCATSAAAAQGAASTTTAAAAQPPEPAKDPLGRETPRGTLLGFMTSARKGNLEAAALHLDTKLRGQPAVDLARQLYIVLDTRLPARLNLVSDRPEGSLANPLKPDQDVIGTIVTEDGPLDLVLAHLDRGTAGSVWLFSRATLEAIPAVYDEIDRVAAESYLPRLLTGPKVGGIRIFQWLAFFVAIPLLYRALGFIGLVAAPMQAAWRRRRGLPVQPPSRLPGAIRLLLLAAAIRLSASHLDLPLFERQFWSATARMVASAAIVWIGLLLNAYGEQRLGRRLNTTVGFGDVTAMLRLARRMADGIVMVIGFAIVLSYFNVDPTAALAGLGIGGIAIALSAQKTLENVIGGFSITFDKAVRVGDFVKLGETSGTVDYIGLRSTRIRTLDRTMLSVPNGQIANVNIETLSARDKFRFTHFIGLGYETSAAQMRTIVADTRKLLLRHTLADDSSIRARFVRLGPWSIDIEVFAYIFARDWAHFLEVQEELLLDVMDIVERAGARIAVPEQRLSLAGADDDPAAAQRIAAVRAALREPDRRPESV